MNIIPQNICMLKKDFTKLYSGNRHAQELLPVTKTDFLPIIDDHLTSLRKFIENNPIYDNSFEMSLCGINCKIYEGDLNQYWIDSIKHDGSYAPFYPTWLLSAYTLASMAKQLGFSHLIDIGAGDGRIAFCGEIVGIKSTSIEIDEQLIDLQNSIIKKTKVFFETINADATQIKFSEMNLIKPVFFIGGVPQNGEILAEAIIKNILEISELQKTSCFVLTGALTKEKFLKNKSNYGWESTLKKLNLAETGNTMLPTYWTMEQSFDTPYLFTKYT